MPNGTLTYKRGEIWWVNLKPVVGSETDKERPCLILQNDIGNQNGATTIVAPLLPGTKAYPFVVNVVPTLQNGLDRERYVNLSQMRAVDAQRFKRKQGVLEEIYWEKIERAICIELGFGSAFKSI
ncbi:type II toxin-antitoxin system PemK/MazF family toxin [Chroococcidiopsis sp. FACHB-1243]|uniref:type II toxin-antitoxin system PemK/MazF family toxin n=1 Tax=Chroococcidiopsis sp. [FACHB-1243] TaxID=2692781 RepID=UPI001783DC57|nr:type II toxin-antitoxin system PemK/MazF family toxin [Chroococcidiopsis sp. [FACHB-1243]]MBD2306048.1 type II toxin-antitoxin system PemK/MazF family toxin [Chroococcidiopsis sp. [FACHB-1243]]